jgi:hypothetical protein
MSLCAFYEKFKGLPLKYAETMIDPRLGTYRVFTPAWRDWNAGLIRTCRGVAIGEDGPVTVKSAHHRWDNEDGSFQTKAEAC